MKNITAFVFALALMYFCAVFDLHAQFSGGGTGTASDPFLIKTADDLNNVRNYIGASNADKHFRLMNDIDLTAFLQNYSEGWLPIGDNSNSFTGYFHGSGYKINGLWINRPTVDYVGFFGANSGAIDSLSITVYAQNISGRSYTGGFVGDNSGTITDCNVEGGSLVTVSGYYAGGFAGNNSNALSSCHATVSSSSSYYYSGGLTGYNTNTGTITNCYATGNSSSSTFSGGLIGYNEGTITNCYATGNSSSNNYSGGFVGYSSGTISNCYANGNSTTTTYYSYSYSGGFVGWSEGVINNCYASGNSSSSYSYYSYSGGFVGWSEGVINNCYASGNSSSSFSCSGGFVGWLNAGKISNCYSVGQVTLATNYIGAFAGNCVNAAYLLQCYFNSDVTGSMSGVGNNVGNNNVLGVTTAGMKLKSTFTNWDFNTIWAIEEGVTYPYLYDMPDYMEGLTSVCANSTQTYSTYSGKSNYVWAVSNGSIVSGQSTNTVTVKWNDNTNSGKIMVTYNDTKSAIRNITLVPLPQPTISGDMKPTAGATVSYNTETNMSDYVWTVTGGDIVSGQGTQQISVKWDCSVSAGHIKINYSNENGCSATAATDSTVNKQANPAPTISGDMKPNAGATVYYNTEAYMSDYVWTVTGGAITSGQGTAQIGIKWDCSPEVSASIKVDYTNQNGCAIVMPSASAVSLQANPAPTISGDMKPNAGATVYYNTEAYMSDYVWTVTGGDISGQGTQQISVKWDCTSDVSASIKVDYTNQNGCAIVMPSASAVSLQANPVPTISGEIKPYVGSTMPYNTEYNMSNYTWTVTGGDIVSGQSTQQISVLWKSTSGKISIQYDNANSCSAQSELAVSPVQLFDSGAGTADSPYIIKTAEQLDNVRNMPNAAYSLANDIDLTDYLKNADTGWNPIPNFSGTFDGEFFKVKGLWINLPTSDNLGLFAANSGTIQDLYVVIDSKGIYGNNYIGGLVANNSGTVYRCAVTEGSITAKGDYIGGLVGNNRAPVTESYSSNTTVFGNQNVGGLVGYNYANGNNAKVHQCYAINTTAGSGYVGGLIGSNYFSAVCSQSYSAGIVQGGNYTGGFMGYNYGGTVSGCYYDEEVSGQYYGLGNNNDSQSNNIYAEYTSDMMKQKTFVAWDFTNVWKINETASYPYFQWQDIAPTPPPTGIAAVSKSALLVNPNPTTGTVTIKCEPQSQLKIYNLSGKMMYQTTSVSGKETIDLSAYPSGVYLIRVGNQYTKLIKK